MKSILHFTLFLAVCVLLAAAPLHAQERTAGQSYDAQVNWSALKSRIDLVNTQNKVLASTLDKVMACNTGGKLYAPADAAADAQGCVSTMRSCPENSTLKVRGGAWKCVVEYSKACGNNKTVYCSGSDVRTACLDTGNGRNHGVTPVGANGCRAWEGSANYGTSNCQLSCIRYQ